MNSQQSVITAAECKLAERIRQDIFSSSDDFWAADAIALRLAFDLLNHINGILFQKSHLKSHFSQLLSLAK